MARYVLQGKPKCLIWKSGLGNWCVALTDDTKCPIGPYEAFDNWAEAIDYAADSLNWDEESWR